MEQYSKPNIVADDLIAIAFEAVVLAISHYKPGSSFFAYWNTIAEREIKRYLHETFKDEETVSLDDLLPSGRQLHDVVSSDTSSLKNSELFDAFISIVNDEKNHFSNNERTVIELFLFGYSFIEISSMMNCSRSKVYYLYHEAVRKIRVLLTGSK